MKNPCECSCCTPPSGSTLCFTQRKGTLETTECTSEACSSRFPDACPQHPYPGITRATSRDGSIHTYNPAVSNVFRNVFQRVFIFQIVMASVGFAIFVYGLVLWGTGIFFKKWVPWTWFILLLLVILYGIAWLGLVLGGWLQPPPPPPPEEFTTNKNRLKRKEL